jgi:hypothetical protein
MNVKMKKKEFLIDPLGNYEPSVLIKKYFWLLISRKKTYIGKSFITPGLFTQDRFVLNSIFFILILILEIWGFINLKNVIPKPLLAFIFTLLDFVLAIFSHAILNKGIVLSKIKKLLASNGESFTKGLAPKGEEAKQKRVLNVLIFIKILFIVAIFFLAWWKIDNFVVYYDAGVLGIIVLMIIIYILSALFQVIFSGNFLFEFVFRAMVNQQKRKVDFSTDTTKYTITNHREFAVPKSLLSLVDIKDIPGVHFLVDKLKKKIYLNVNGVLQDRTISDILTALKSEDENFKKKVALFLIKVQLEIREMEIYRLTKNK